MLLSNVSQTPKAQMFGGVQNPQSMDYKYSFADDTTYVIVPQKLKCSREYKNS